MISTFTQMRSPNPPTARSLSGQRETTMNLKRLTDKDVTELIIAKLFHPVNFDDDGLLWPNYRYLNPDMPPYAQADGCWKPISALPENDDND